MEIDLNKSVDSVLDAAQNLQLALAATERVTGERVDLLMFAAASIVAWTMAVEAAAPTGVASTVINAAGELTGLLLTGIAARKQDEGEAFGNLFGSD
jgi:hypothetical protein